MLARKSVYATDCQNIRTLGIGIFMAKAFQHRPSAIIVYKIHDDDDGFSREASFQNSVRNCLTLANRSTSVCRQPNSTKLSLPCIVARNDSARLRKPNTKHEPK
ncbi:hypothetical protein T09_10026 [Trichinella sp. T9]|uniref:Uncharacterized protein n=1 Tax=Trichinella murrelli TaxID=144512 RepID=A0A0V0UF25_9BILA|nr:hypothetical protein T05_8930 [Trichinella murrelli]KRX57811.1 hypothetical protein T09_10026 [Trichinella sp. T9]